MVINPTEEFEHLHLLSLSDVFTQSSLNGFFLGPMVP
jgi:hypothetical protein